MAARRVVTVILDAIPTGFVAGLRTSAVAAKAFGKELDTMAVKHTGAFNKITNTVGLVGAGLVGAFALAERATMAFDAQMSKVGAVAGASAKELDRLRGAALQAGKDTAFTATQAAQAEEELAKAGVSAADILGGALAGTLNLAAAGSLELADAAKIAAQAMVEFELKGKDVGNIADVLSAGANQSVASVESLGQALNQVGSIAHYQAHFGLAETVGVLAAFSNHGLDGEEAGTALKTALIKLQNPTEKAAALMKHLGINMYDANGQFISAAGVAGQLQQGLSGVSEQERNAALATIFGTRAIRGAVVLYNMGAMGVQLWTDKVNASGSASDTSRKKLDNLSGDVHKLMGSLQALAIGATSNANSGLRLLAQGAEHTANAFAGLPGPLQAVVGDVAAFGGAGLLATAGVLKVRGAILNLNASLAASGPPGAKFSGFLGKVGKAGGVIGIAAVATFGLYEGMKAFDDWIEKTSAPRHRDLEQLTVDLRSLAETGKITGELAKVFGADLSKLTADINKVAAAAPQLARLDRLQQFAGRGGGGVNMQRNKLLAATAQDRADVVALDQQLAQLASSGGVSQAKIAFNDITALLEAQHVPLATINAMFPQYAAAAHSAAVGTSALAQGFASTNQQLGVMNKGLADAIEHGETLDSVFKELNGANISATETEITFKQGLDDLKKALQGHDKVLTRHKRSLDDDTQAGRDNLSGIINLIKQADAHAQAVLDQTDDIQGATKAYNDQIGALRGVLTQAGFTAGQIDFLIKQYGKMPAVQQTIITTPGMASAISGLQTIYTWMGLVNGRRVKIHVDTTSVSASTRFPRISVNRWGGLYTHAAVGTLREATYAPPVSRGARYAWAEPETRGEIFIPKSGNYGRSMALIRAAAGWYGASVMPSGGSPTIVINASADARAFFRFLRLQVQNHGGVKAFS